MIELQEEINNTFTVSNFETTLQQFVPMLSSVVIASFVYFLVRRSLYSISRGKALI